MKKYLSIIVKSPFKVRHAELLHRAKLKCDSVSHPNIFSQKGIMKSISFANSRQRIVAIFLLLTFLNTLVPYNVIYANNGGPQAPEAASFEPIDATDMVNLNTGAFTYVLPLLNIPSPEGGYPIALSYHAGIAADQEASWAGLGWNLNPGAINRSVNGYPDDYLNSTLSEFFYDNGDTITSHSVSLGYSYGGVSVGVGMSWGSHQATSGFVSLGYGAEGIGVNFTAGIGQASSIGIGGGGDHFSFGISLSTDGSVGVNAGPKTGGDNSTGFSIGANTNGTYSASISNENEKSSTITSVGVSFRDGEMSGVSVKAVQSKRHTKTDEGGNTKSYSTYSGAGLSLNMALSHAVESGDYLTTNSRSMSGLIIPTPIGIFSISGTSQKYEYFLAEGKENYISGPLHFDENTKSERASKIKCWKYERSGHGGGGWRYTEPFYGWVYTDADRVNIFNQHSDCGTYKNSQNQQVPRCGCNIEKEINYTPQQDIDEFPIEDYGLGRISYLLANNISLPSYDAFHVQAQGLSGTMSLRMQENAALFGLGERKSQGGYTGHYDINSVSSDIGNHLKFNSKPYFEFDNEITNYLGVDKVQFDPLNINQSKPSYYYKSGAKSALSRRYTSNYIEHYTYKDIRERYNNGHGTLLQEGFLFSDDQLGNNLLFHPPGEDTNIPLSELDGKIAAFKITALDGKTYHYSLPVYNHEIVTQQHKLYGKSYLEKRQLSPFATHWLLTAVTGPDFIDVNANGNPDQGDYGYWTRFEYGKWSDGFIWEKGESFGRKEIYYLNKIKTRTHTAVFVKSENEFTAPPEDNYWYLGTYYRTADHINAVTSGDRKKNAQGYDKPIPSRFHIPRENLLKLDKVVLLKNEDDNVSENTDFGAVTVSNYHYPQSEKSNNILLTKSNYGEVITHEDIAQTTYGNSLKVIDLLYKKNTELLKAVGFKGKANQNIIPPYKFTYNGKFKRDDYTKLDDWGYLPRVESESLATITTPTGGKLQVKYEENDFYKPLIDKGKKFNKGFEIKVLDWPSTSASYTPRDAENFEQDYRIEIKPKRTESPIIEGTGNAFYIYDVPDLEDIFELGRGVFIDLWLSAVDNYKNRGYHRSSIDIKPKIGEVISLDNDKMIIRVKGSSPFRRGGYETDKEFYVSDDKNQNKGRYDLAWVNDGKGEAFSLQYTIVGNKKPPINSKGGGLRVKQITSIDDTSNNKYHVTYDYEFPDELLTNDNDDQKSSGSLSYIPHKYNDYIPYSSQLPSPRVMYEYVTVTQNDESKTRYHFNVMKPKDRSRLKFGDSYAITENKFGRTDPFFNNSSLRDLCMTDFTIEDNLSNLGLLLDTKSYNKENQLLGEEINTYYTKNELDNLGYGITQESYQMYKKVDFVEDQDPIHDASLGAKGKWFITASTKKKYPNLLKSTTSISGSYKYTTEFLDFDLVTGQAQKTRTYNALGEELIVENTAAYKKYPDMGHKLELVNGNLVVNNNHKHMLAQPAYSISKLKIQDGSEHILGADITTWNNVWKYKNPNGSETTETNNSRKVWRKDKEYVWDGDIDNDGFYQGYNETNQDGFNWGLGVSQSSSSRWKKTSERTLYNHYSKLLETQDINENYASTKMCDGETKTLAVSNAQYDDMYYVNAEYPADSNGYYSRGVTSSATRTDVKFHTGSQTLHAANANTEVVKIALPNSTSLNTYRGEKFDRKYKISVWTHKNQVSFNTDGSISSINAKIKVNSIDQPNAFSLEESVRAGDWVLLNGEIQLPNTSNAINISLVSTVANSYYDDYRIYPMSSSMTGYVYNEWDELSYIVGNNGLSTHYIYNEVGELSEVQIEVVDFKGQGTGGFKKSVTHKKYF